MNISTLYPSLCMLGESPMWHSLRKSYFWVDIHSSQVYELNRKTRKLQTWQIGHSVSLIIEGKGDTVLLAVKGGVLNFNLATGGTQWRADLYRYLPENRCNDGACDCMGRLWVGTMDMDCKDNAGSLYRIDFNLNIEKVIGRLTIPNGLVWSLDNERMYFIDSPSRCIKSYFFNKRSGEIYFEKIAVTIPALMGMPDGMTIDAEGKLWVALWGGKSICRYDPLTGNLLDTIKLPAINITNCKFAGEELDHLIITSAREGLSDAQLEQYPESGNVFITSKLPVGGVKANTLAL